MTLDVQPTAENCGGGRVLCTCLMYYVAIKRHEIPCSKPEEI